MTDFPPNSDVSREGPPEPSREPITPIATGTRRKQTTGQRFSKMFFSGDAKTAGSYVGSQVLLPAVKDMVYQGFAQLMEKIIFGDSRPRRGWTPPPSGPAGWTNYSQYSRQSGYGPTTQMMRQTQEPPVRTMSRQARTHHNFDEIVLPTRADAEAVIEMMFELVSKYDSATVADLYQLVGLNSAHTDYKWGWTDMRGSSAGPLRGGGYLLNLPEPSPL